MRRATSLRRGWLAVVPRDACALALVAIGVGGTVAASNPATLYACFNVSGAVSMSASNTCLLPGGGRLATINAVGVAGPAGATGVAGPTGATGPTGPTGPAASTWTGYSIPLHGVAYVHVPGAVEYATAQCLGTPYAPSIRVGYDGPYSPRPGQWLETAFGTVTDLGGGSFDLLPGTKVHVTIDDSANAGPINDWTFLLESAGATCEVLVGVS